MEAIEETEEIEFMDDFFLTSGSKHPSLMEVPFAIQEIEWERSQEEKMYVQGKCNGGHELSVEIDMWKLELPLEGKPKFLVRQVSGAWMELRKPRDFYMETMKVVLVAANFLIFAKQSPNSSKGAVWRYVRKECGEFKAKPNQQDLIKAFLLLQSIVTSDPKLQASPIIPQFFPSFSKKPGSQVAQGSNDTRKRLRKGECSPVSKVPIVEGPSRGKKDTSSVEVSPPVGDVSKGESSLQSTPKMRSLAEFEDSPPVVDISKGESSLKSTPRMRSLPEFEDSPPVVDISKGGSSLQSTPRTRSLAEFSTEADLPLPERLTPAPKKRKPGRPPGRHSLRKYRKESDDGSVVGDDDWINEPDVCAFCDDGVEKGEKLLCCDGPCMRSFHPTEVSGRQNQCPTLCLTRAAVTVETWICPNCEAGQHQCFACGKLGNSTTSTDPQEVFVCGAKQCKRFYHPDCVAKLLVPEAAQKDLASRIQQNLETFTCPLHKCASCNLDEDKTNPRLFLIKCRRCPEAWHENCLPEVCRSQLWPLEGGKFVMYCGRHKLDPELLTPKRDHIKFPALKTAGRVSGPKFSRLLLSFIRPSSESPGPGPGGGAHHLRAYQKVRDIISESCRAVTLETVKKNVRAFSPT